MYQVTHKNRILAIILPHTFNESGIKFFTPDDFSQQLGHIQHPKGTLIHPHRHNITPRKVFHTQEVLFIKRGKLRVDFYDEQENYLKSHTLKAGDTILLASGGHGFEVLEEVAMIEVKQGPYAGEADKTRFEGIDTQYLILGDKNSNE